ncbi:MAG: arylsulfotransferase family protein [Planctomycetota bacterium]
MIVAIGLSGVVGYVLGGRASSTSADPSTDEPDAPMDAAPSERASPPRGRPIAGAWAYRRSSAAASELSDEQRAKIEELSALGYASGVKPVRGDTGVTAYDPDGACPGFNLYVAGHAREAILTDMEGRPVHRWLVPPLSGVDLQERETPDGGAIRPSRHDFLGVAHLFENGDLLAVHGNSGISKVDRDSRVIWERANGSHHDLFVAEDGTVFVVTREARMVPDYHPTEPLLEDFITVLDADGNERSRVSILRAFLESDFAPLLQYAPPYGDLLHTNTIEVLDGRFESRSPAFRKGNVLISLKYMSTIAIVDPEAGKVVWALAGRWQRQHRPTVLDNGNILLFDNLGGRPETGASRVIEFDPVTQEAVWIYEGTRDNVLESHANGSVQRLPNGNTLIIESHGGRALEVTQEKEIVWEFVNPHRAGNDGGLIAVLFDLVRIPPDFPTDWANK